MVHILFQINKEEYEKLLSTMEQAWRKQFQELDKKYQNEIKKLQEEVKTKMENYEKPAEKIVLEKDEQAEGSRNHVKIMTKERKPVNFEREIIRHMNFPDEETDSEESYINIKIQKKNKDINKNDRNKVGDDSLSINRAEVDTNGMNKVEVNGRKKYPPTNQKQESSKQGKSLGNSVVTRREQSLNKEVDGQKRLPADKQHSEISTLVKSKIQTQEESKRPQKITRQTSVFDHLKTFEESKNKIVNENLQRKEPKIVTETSNKKQNNQSLNYTHFLEYLDNNDKLSTNQIKEITKESTVDNQIEKVASFFPVMEKDIIDFNTSTEKNNVTFYDDNFAKKIGREIAIDAGPAKTVFDDKFFGAQDNLFNLETRRKTLSKIFDDEKIYLDEIKNTENKKSRIKESEKEDKKELTNALKVIMEQESKLDKILTKFNGNSTNESATVQNAKQQTLKHSDKYFGDIRLTKAEPKENSSKALDESKSEELIVIDPEAGGFYDEIITSNESFDTSLKEDFNNILDQIRGKELSIIDEETEADSSLLSSVRSCKAKEDNVLSDGGSSSKETSKFIC